MKYIVDTAKTPDQAAEALEAAARGRKFGVLHVHDLQRTLEGKGFAFPHACRVLEICSPPYAHQVLTRNIEMNLALPCRVSVYEQGGVTKIGMMLPTAILEMLSDDEEIRAVAEKVERDLVAIVDEAK